MKTVKCSGCGKEMTFNDRVALDLTEKGVILICMDCVRKKYGA